ncbi:MAG: glycosyltransferase family 39 protein [bacterium]|nr:glycosyltransferase family 39 protein [bacterium]
MNKFFGWKGLLLLVIILAFFLRAYRIDSLPDSLNPDEAAIGYTSYSLLMSGMDEHGKFLPLTTQSFGDWKLPLYSYVGVIPVALFGLSEFSVRSVSMLAGVVGVLLIYFISKNLFGRRSIALFSALFFAISPWNIYFSRAAYEVNLATTIFLGGLLAFLKYVYGEKKDVRLIAVSFLLFALTILTYHSYVLLTPVFVLGLIIFFRKSIFKNKISYIPFLLFIVLCFVFIFAASSGSNKLSTLIINDKNVIYERVEKLRGDNSIKNPLLDRALFTKYLGVPYQIAQNYLNSFSPSFLFDKGGEKLVHNIGAFGNLYLFDSILLLAGVLGIFWNREKSIKLLAIWLIVAPISSAITKDAPNSTRLFILMPLFVLIASYGAYQIFILLKKRTIMNLTIRIVLISLFLLNIIYFLNIYFVHFNVQRSRFWHYGYREAVKLTDKYPTYNVVMRGPENFPYIYFLFYEKYNPLLFREEVVYYPPTHEGFYYVRSFGRYQFVNKIDYSSLAKNTIYIDDTRLDDKENSIFLPSGEPILGLLYSEQQIK